MRWDPNKKHPGGSLPLLIGGWTHCFTILFSCWFSITTIKNPIVPNQKKNESATPILYPQELGTYLRDDLAEVLLSEQMWESTFGSHWIHFGKTGVYSILVVGWNLIRRKALKNAALRNVTFQKGWQLTRHDESRWSAQYFKEIAHRFYYLPRLPICMTPFWPLVYVGKPSLATG